MNIKGILFKDRSLHYKFTLVTVVPILIVLIFIVLFVNRELEKTLINETLNQARQLTGLSVLSMSNPFVIYNKALLDNFIDSP